jgi:hypothetical protein
MWRCTPSANSLLLWRSCLYCQVARAAQSSILGEQAQKNIMLYLWISCLTGPSEGSASAWPSITPRLQIGFQHVIMHDVCMMRSHSEPAGSGCAVKISSEYRQRLQWKLPSQHPGIGAMTDIDILLLMCYAHSDVLLPWCGMLQRLCMPTPKTDR